MIELQSGASEQKLNAAVKMWHLTRSSQPNRDGVIAAGALPLLVALLRSDQPAVQEAATGCCGNLSSGSQLDENAIIAAGAVPLLVALLSSHHPALQEAAAIP